MSGDLHGVYMRCTLHFAELLTVQAHAVCRAAKVSPVTKVGPVTVAQ